MARANHLRQEREDWLSSPAAVDAAVEELERLFAHLETEVAAIKEVSAAPAIEYQRKKWNRVCMVRTPFASFTLGWSQQYSNSLRYSNLLLREFDGTYFFEDDGGGLGRGATVRSETNLAFTLDDAGIKGWHSDEPNSRFYSSIELGEQLLKQLLDRVAEIQAQRRGR